MNSFKLNRKSRTIAASSMLTGQIGIIVDPTKYAGQTADQDV